LTYKMRSGVHKLLRRLCTTKPKVGFIGLGQMGGRMAANLLKSGNSLVVYDVVPENVAEAERLGAENVSSPKDVAVNSHLVITMLPNSAIVRDVYFGAEGLFSGCSEESTKMFIDSSTIDPVTCQDLANHIQSKLPKSSIIDAPVSGGVTGAENATLTFMCGGPEKVVEEARTVLMQMGKNVLHAGDAPGTGQMAKLCNNLTLAISMHGVAEGMRIGVEFGMDKKKLADIMNVSSGRCWSSDTYNPCPGVIPTVPSSNDYVGGFAINLMLKDLGLALGAAEQVGVETPLAKLAQKEYQLVADEGHGMKDFGYVYQMKKSSNYNIE